ncbi:hypothetical protein MASR2M78_23260 [Treponema sp.]
METLLISIVALAFVFLLMLLFILLRPKRSADTQDRLLSISEGQSRIERSLREELAISRAELERFGQGNEARLEALRDTVDRKLREIQADNASRLDAIRKTVDEKLHETLERRLGESFKLVGERLELVQAGLGEMKTLATGVGDLKRVLVNVKNRGTGEKYSLSPL